MKTLLFRAIALQQDAISAAPRHFRSECEQGVLRRLTFDLSGVP